MGAIESWDVPTDPKTREYVDFRDRVSFVYVTGLFPSHQQAELLGKLRAISTPSDTPVSLDGSMGCMKVNAEVVKSLRLEEHPMVRKVRTNIANGLHLNIDPNSKARRSFRKICMADPETGKRLVVHIDGSVLDL